MLTIVVAYGPSSSALAAVGNTANTRPEKPGSNELIAYDIANAGRLRMQSQRLAKLYQQLGLGINVPVATRQIGLASTEVDVDLVKLSLLAKKPKMQSVVVHCDALWQELRTALKVAPTPSAKERVSQLADELMIHAGKLSMLVEAEAATPVGRLLDLSSRLNMLSQRLARLYLMAQGGDRSQGVLIDLEQARKEFAVGLNELDTAQENSPASREAIALARNQWIFFELAIGQLNRAGEADGKAALHVVTSSERIAEALEAAQMQYVKDYVASVRRGR